MSRTGLTACQRRREAVERDQVGEGMLSCRQKVISQAPVSANRAWPGSSPDLPERKIVRKALTTVRSRIECHLREVAILRGTGKWEIPTWEYRWSSARAHVARRDDGPVPVGPMLKRVRDWKEFLRRPEEAAVEEALRSHERTGRPPGSGRFAAKIERLAGRMPHGLSRRRRSEGNSYAWCPRYPSPSCSEPEFCSTLHLSQKRNLDKSVYNKKKHNEHPETKQTSDNRAADTVQSNADGRWHTAVAVGVCFRGYATDFPGLHSVII